MNRLFLFLPIMMWLSPMIACAGQPKVTDVDWEWACGGSNIRVTRVDRQIVAIEAFAEHSTEGRGWICLLKEGEIISALYRHSIIKHTNELGKDGVYITEQHEDIVKTFHFPDHKLSGMDKALLKDLQEVIAKAKAGR